MNDIPLASDSVAFPVLSASSFAGGQGLGLNDECPVQMVGTDVCLAVGQNGHPLPDVGAHGICLFVQSIGYALSMHWCCAPPHA